MTKPWYVVGFEDHYLELYSHRSPEEARASLSLLELAQVNARGKRVLDLACGGGRHMAALADLGAHAVGIDLSRVLLEEARKNGEDGQPLVRGDMRKLPFANASFDGVISMFTSFGYFVSEAENWSVMAEAKRVLAPTAWLLFDFLNSDRVRDTLTEKSEREGERWRAIERRRIEGDRVLKTVSIVKRDGGEELSRYEESVRLFSPSELRAGFDKLGFIERHCWGDYAGSPWSPASQRFILLLERAKA